MKTKILLSATLGCSLLAFSLPAAAQGNSNSVHTVERFDAKFVLDPTPDGPPGAKGTVELKSNNRDGTQTATVSEQIQGLDPGDYNINGVLASDGSTVALGTFTIPDTTNGNSNAPHRRLKSKSTLEPPPDVDLADVQEIIVTDAGGTALLTGDATDPAGKSKMTLNAVVPLTPGDAAPDASGTARLRSSLRKGVRKTNFSLIANNVPADSTFTVNVDGTDAGTVTSNHRGRVLVKSLPDTVTTIGTVSLVDTNGATVVSANF